MDDGRTAQGEGDVPLPPLEPASAEPAPKENAKPAPDEVQARTILILAYQCLSSEVRAAIGLWEIPEVLPRSVGLVARSGFVLSPCGAVSA